MMQIKSRALLCLVLLIASFAQGKQSTNHSLLGAWRSLDIKKVTAASSDFVFSEDGTYRMEVRDLSQGPTFTTTVIGTFKLTGDAISLKMKSVEMKSTDKNLQQRLDVQNQYLAASVGKLPEMPGTVVWQKDGSVTLKMEAVAGQPAQDFHMARKAEGFSLVGHWSSLEVVANGGASSDFTFNADGTYRMEAGGKSKRVKIQTIVTGVYKLNGNDLSLKLKNLTVVSSNKKMRADFDQQSAIAREKLKKQPELPGRLDWQGANKVTLKMEAVADQPAREFHLERKKGA